MYRLTKEVEELLVIFNDSYFLPVRVVEYTIMPSGKIVVMIEDSEGNPESLWFYSDGTNPKSKLIKVKAVERNEKDNRQNP